MSTSAQTTANRENAKHSTGPTTDSGKSTCGRNSLKHGLASSQLIVGDESEEDFDAFLTCLIAEYQPATTTETLLVQDMAKFHWLADRALRLQNEALSPYRLQGDLLPAGLAVLIRYHTANQRAFEKSLATLLSIRKEAQKSTIGSVPQKAPKSAAKPDPAPRRAAPATSVAQPTPDLKTTLHADGCAK